MDKNKSVTAPLTQEEIRQSKRQSDVDHERQKSKARPLIPVSDDAPKFTKDTPAYHNKKFGCKPSAIYEYRWPDGKLAGYIVRWDDVIQKDGSKTKVFIPYTFCESSTGERKWWSRSLPEPWPLYNAHYFVERPNASIMVCEGEKTVEAAIKLLPDYITTTSMHGSHSPHKTDWSPIKGRKVVVATDHDEAGNKYGETIFKLCQQVGAQSVHFLNMSLFGQFTVEDGLVVAQEGALPKSYDLADAAEEGWTAETIGQLKQKAEELNKPWVLESVEEVKRQLADENLIGINQAAIDVDKEIKQRHKSTQTDILIELAQQAELFHTPNKVGYADLNINVHRETWPIRSKNFRFWLSRLFFEHTQRAPSPEAIKAALNSIEAKAYYDSPERPVYIRVGNLADKIYLDFANPTWQAVEIDATGWRVIDKPPVRFLRSAGMKPLPTPARGGNIEQLRSFLNVSSDNDFVLAVSWLLGALRNHRNYPILALSGEQGSAKSTFSSILKALLDPNTSPLRTLPREEQDLFISANNSHVLAFDNISNLSSWLSDTLCRLSTGGGFSTRQLYTTDEEVLFEAARPVILNGIEDIVTRSDLADRSIFLTLEPISEDRRRLDNDLWVTFNEAHPSILGVLLDAMVEGLKRLPDIRLQKLPRMADFALWATACETALWSEGTFLSAYNRNRNEVIENVLDADPIAVAVRNLMTDIVEWKGTATELLAKLKEVMGEDGGKTKMWPGNPRALGGRLRRAATFLRKIGIEISKGERRGKKGDRIITISSLSERESILPSVLSVPPAPIQKANVTNGVDIDSRLTQIVYADAKEHKPISTVSLNPLQNIDNDRTDKADANLPYPSESSEPFLEGDERIINRSMGKGEIF